MTKERRQRLNDMIRLFKQSGRGWTVHELAAKYHLTERQIQRDLCTIMSDPDYAPLITRCVVRREYLHMATAYREGCGR